MIIFQLRLISLNQNFKEVCPDVFSGSYWVCFGPTASDTSRNPVSPRERVIECRKIKTMYLKMCPLPCIPSVILFYKFSVLSCFLPFFWLFESPTFSFLFKLQQTRLVTLELWALSLTYSYRPTDFNSSAVGLNQWFPKWSISTPGVYDSLQGVYDSFKKLGVHDSGYQRTLIVPVYLHCTISL